MDATVVPSRAAAIRSIPAPGPSRFRFWSRATSPTGSASSDRRYEIIEVVGHGGMGAVLRAFDTKLSRVVAVKVMAPELAANPTAVKRFLREATTAAAVHHDHVVTIHAVDDAHQPPYLVMQFVEGQTLQQKIDREGALELKQILRIGSQTAAGLAAAHKTGLIHRDVKPANILLENGVERVKITDFGLARAADDVQMTQTGMIAGTPQYMSPEQAKGEPIDARSDLFSLGSVLYTMCTGRPAFRADNTVAVLRRVCDDTPRPIREVNPEIPEWLEAIVDKLLAKDPATGFRRPPKSPSCSASTWPTCRTRARSSTASNRRTAGQGEPAAPDMDGASEEPMPFRSAGPASPLLTGCCTGHAARRSDNHRSLRCDAASLRRSFALSRAKERS